MKTTTNTKKTGTLSKESINGAKKQIDAFKAKKSIIDILTISKNEHAHVLMFTPEYYHLLVTKSSNNRATTKPYKKHQDNISNSIDQCGILSAIAVDYEKGVFGIAEGANRVAVLKANNYPIYAFISKASFSDTFTMMNMFVKPLRYKELVNHCTKDGANTKHYQALESITKYHENVTKEAKKIGKIRRIQSCLIHGLLAGVDRSISKNLVLSKLFKTTEALKGQTKRITKQIYELQNVGLETGTRVNEGIIGLMLEKGNRYNHTKMVEIIRKSDKIYFSTSSGKRNTNILRDLHDNTVNGLPKIK